MSDTVAVVHDSHDIPHATGSKYVQIACILFVLTALEVLLYEVCFGHLSGGGFSSALAPHFVSVLLVLSAMKFWFVAMFYMHLKFDIKILSWLFGFSLMIASVVILALFVLFTYNRTLWWWTGAWH
ncbi:MAG TPA: cytochrome C oxidase subunit IV family protein [Gemmatimonadales bacterium]|jgi:cytochrome c oxidase subunit 4